MSTRAVLELADRVIAIDASHAMLRAAQPKSRARYLVAAAERIPLYDTAAERIPLYDAAADLATVAAAFHWFDQPRAFTELARVLRPGAGLAVYTDFFHGQLSGQPAFTTWLKEAFLSRYPAPPRRAHFDPAAALTGGFGEARYAEGGIRIRLTPAQLADYLLSQSNAATAIQSGTISADTLRNHILDETAAFFPRQGHAAAVFGIRVWTTLRRG